MSWGIRKLCFSQQIGVFNSKNSNNKIKLLAIVKCYLISGRSYKKYSSWFEANKIVESSIKLPFTFFNLSKQWNLFQLTSILDISARLISLIEYSAIILRNIANWYWRINFWLLRRNKIYFKQCNYFKKLDIWFDISDFYFILQLKSSRPEFRIRRINLITGNR